MKNIYKILAATAAISSLAGCIGNFEEYNTDPYAIRNEDPSVIIPSMFDPLMYVQQNDAQMIDMMVGTLGGYFAMGSRWGGQNFDTFNASDDWNATPYNKPFTTLFSNYFKVEKSTKGEGHYYAFAKLLKAAGMMRVADCYGAIPYSMVKDGEMYVPYDSNEDVYKHIIADLKDAAATLTTYVSQFPSSKPLALQDPVYAGDYSLWIKFANSMILRAAMRSGDAEAFKEAYNSSFGYISTNAENALMDPKTQGNPVSIIMTWNGSEVVVASSIVDYMNGYNDPRRPGYFQKCTAEGQKDKFAGMRRGNKELPKEKPYYSLPNIVTSTKMPVLLASEVQFLFAEAVVKGWIDGDAKTFYEQGIRLSMQQYGVEGSDIDAYIANTTLIPDDHNDLAGGSQNYTRQTEVKIAWDAESTDEKHLEQIITQKWIANWPMGLEAWADFRRTGYPELAPTVDNLNPSVITNTARGMRRLRYPYTERNLNRANYDAAVASLGGADNEATELFWTKKN